MRGKILIVSTCMIGCSALAFYLFNAESTEQMRDRYLAEGSQYAIDGKSAEATIMFKNAIQIDVNFAEAHQELGLALMQRREFPQAFAELRRALELKPTLIKSRHYLGSLYLAERNITLAKEQLAKIREQDQNALESRFLSAAVALVENNPDTALNELRAAARRAEKENSPQLGEIYLELGNVQLLTKAWGEAEIAYKKVIKVSPKLLRAREGLAATY